MTQYNEAQFMQEFMKRAQAFKLQVDCLGTGRLDSEICIIAEAPGEREAAMKMPLVGGSGSLVWNTLRPSDITRKDCYITNVIKKQVAMSTKTDARSPISKPELEHWEGLLDWELDCLPQLKFILALGNAALHALTGDSGITNGEGVSSTVKLARIDELSRL